MRNTLGMAFVRYSLWLLLEFPKLKSKKEVEIFVENRTF